jgi:hypothetical protein
MLDHVVRTCKPFETKITLGHKSLSLVANIDMSFPHLVVRKGVATTRLRARNRLVMCFLVSTTGKLSGQPSTIVYKGCQLTSRDVFS